MGELGIRRLIKSGESGIRRAYKSGESGIQRAYKSGEGASYRPQGEGQSRIVQSIARQEANKRKEVVDGTVLKASHPKYVVLPDGYKYPLTGVGITNYSDIYEEDDRVSILIPFGSLHKSEIIGFSASTVPRESDPVVIREAPVYNFLCALSDGLKGCREYTATPQAFTKVGQFSSEENDGCSRVCLDTGGNIYMAEGGTMEDLRKYSSDGTYIDEWKFEVI